MTDQVLTTELFQEVFTALKEFVEERYGEGESLYFFRISREKILPYFHHAGQFDVDDRGELVLKEAVVNDRYLLAFAVWMQQYLKEVQQEIIGLTIPEIEALTEAHKTSLETSGFYEFFHQAEELEYE